ncbi:hypothetical protein [Nocardia sp. NPDC059236]|uniref:hypothetical protein n=1 Tax=Nocardia sp. NPDC059236 TaxID=3346783 RepID=UPI0036A8D731
MNQAPITVDHWAFQAAIQPAVSEFMNSLAPDAPALWWHMLFTCGHLELRGMVEAGRYSDPAAVAEQWAALLGLEDEETLPGMRMFRGRLPGLDAERVGVWYIADRAEFEAEAARAIAASDRVQAEVTQAEAPAAWEAK